MNHGASPRRQVRRAIAMAALLVAAALPARAGFDPGELGACRGIAAEFDEGRDAVAWPRTRGDGALAIHVNPFRFNLSLDTVRWLYFRQCALAPDLVAGADTFNDPIPAQHEYADCAALGLMNAENKIRKFTLEVIMREIDKGGSQALARDLGGPRDIDLFSCKF